MTITTIILDYGCVLSVPPSLGDFEPLRKVFGVEPPAFQELYWRHREAYDLDALGVSGYWQQLGRDIGITFSPEQVDNLAHLDWQMWGRPNPVMVEWVRLLHVRGVKTALISNLSRAFATYLRRTAKWVELFDHLCFSGELGFGKPDERIYNVCLQALGVPASETLFLDDRQVNVTAARALRMHAIVFSSVERLQEDLEPSELKQALLQAQAGAGDLRTR
jgi:putative hydrolase of the HAD superfamily